MTLPTGTVTFLFTDIEGSTKLAQQYPGQWEMLRGRHHAILQSVMDAQNGYVFQIIGDAFCAAFSSAIEALNAALEAQRCLLIEEWSPAPVKVRMGIHSGTAQLKEDGQYIGYAALAMTQRIMSAGHGGQVLISGATRELVRDMLPEDISLLDLGEKRLKDLQRPESLYQLSAAGLPDTFPPLKTLDSFPNNLPMQLTTFIGREHEILAARQMLENHHLVTLTGPGGTGKTRLSLQVAANLLETFENGVWFVELAPLNDPDLIPQTILSTIGISEQPGKTPLALLKEYLHRKTALIVLDNCEHLVQGCARVANDLLNTAPGLKILASSREALGVHGEATYPVPSLSLPDPKHLPAIEQVSQYEAVRLFIDRALLVQPHFVVTNENAPAVAQICYRLDGIPLAIELAAARVKALSPDQIARRLDDRFRLLTGGSRTALERQQTLRATLDWSYNLLSEEEKLLLCRLSVFSGGWTLESVEQICAGKNDISSDQVLDLLVHLVDKSLVTMDGSRYHMLETTRQYAQEKFLDSGESEWVRDQHMDFFLKLAEEAEARLSSAEQVVWLERLDLEQGNLRAALKWGLERNVEAGLRLVSALWLFWFMRTRFIEGRQWYDEALVVGKTASPMIKIRLLIGAASNALGQNDFERTAALSEQSLILSREQENAWGIAMSLHHLGVAATAHDDYERARSLLEEGLVLARERANSMIVNILLSDLGVLAGAQGDYEMASLYLEDALSLDRKYENRWGIAYDFQFLALIAYEKKDYLKSKVLVEQAITLAHEFQDRRLTFYLLGRLATLALAEGKAERAARMISAAETLSEASGISFSSDERDVVAAIRERLGDVWFEALAAEGRAMTTEQAVAYALGKSDE